MQFILVALCFMRLSVIHVVNNEISFKGIKEPLAQKFSSKDISLTSTSWSRNPSPKPEALPPWRITMSWNRTNYIKYPEFKQLSGMTREQIDVLVTRLNTSKPSDENADKKKAMSKPLSQEQLADMLERLANAVKNKEKTPESQRTGAGRVMGVVNTYAWMDGRLLKSRITRPDGNWY